jgi:pyruvate dehydrogenase E2 component (dihydrolipoamide acetyltransferase)
MAFVFELPEIGEGVVEGEVVAWKVNLGDAVRVDQPLCEIMTDKATVEISSPKAGTIVKLHGKPGDIIKVHTPLAEIDTDGKGANPALAEPAPAAAKPAPAAAKPAPAAAAAPAAPKTAPKPPPPAPKAPAGPARAAPAVRRHAREENVDIQAVAGTGPNGRITHTDVEAAANSSAPMPLVAPSLPQVTPSGTESRVKIIGLRRKIAEQMRKSRSTAAHFTYVEEVDCTRLVDLRERLKGRAEKAGVKLTYLPIIAKACSIVFREFPNVNAVMDEDAFELVVKGDHNIGFAVDTPNGLFVPVVKNVEQKSILHIAAELTDLSNRTRAGKARSDELQGSTFTITGVGSIGGVLATPILNVPEVAILGTNAIRDAAVVRNGQIVIRKMMMLSPSFDHRIIDGAVGARFTAALKAVLEEPESLLLELA